MKKQRGSKRLDGSEAPAVDDEAQENQRVRRSRRISLSRNRGQRPQSPESMADPGSKEARYIEDKESGKPGSKCTHQESWSNMNRNDCRRANPRQSPRKQASRTAGNQSEEGSWSAGTAPSDRNTDTSFAAAGTSAILHESAKGLVSLSLSQEEDENSSSERSASASIKKTTGRRISRVSKSRARSKAPAAGEWNEQQEMTHASSSPPPSNQDGAQDDPTEFKSGPVWPTTNPYMRLPPNEASQSHPVPPGMILEPGPNDVVLGRGRPYQFFQGNIKMMAFVERHKDEYNGLPRSRRRGFGYWIVDELAKTGARFLQKIQIIVTDGSTQQIQPRDQKASDDANGIFFWEEVSREVAFSKVTHVLRGTRHPRKKTQYKGKTKDDPRPQQFKKRKIDVAELETCAVPPPRTEETWLTNTSYGSQNPSSMAQPDVNSFTASHVNPFQSVLQQTQQANCSTTAGVANNSNSDSINESLQAVVSQILGQRLQSQAVISTQGQTPESFGMFLSQRPVPSLSSAPVADVAAHLLSLLGPLLTQGAASTTASSSNSIAEQFLSAFLAHHKNMTNTLGLLAEMISQQEQSRLAEQQQQATNEVLLQNLLSAILPSLSSSSTTTSAATSMPLRLSLFQSPSAALQNAAASAFGNVSVSVNNNFESPINAPNISPILNQASQSFGALSDSSPPAATVTTNAASTASDSATNQQHQLLLLLLGSLQQPQQEQNG